MKKSLKRIQAGFLALVMMLLLVPAAAFAAPAEEAKIVDVQALTLPGHFGQKLKAVIIQYSVPVDASRLTPETFTVKALSNNLTGEYADATIERVYTNITPDILDSGSVTGNYVIVETNDLDKVGLVADNYYYVDETGEEKSIAVRKDLMGNYEINVTQNASVYGIGGAEIPATGEAITVDQSKISHKVLDEFQYVQLTDEQANDYLSRFTFGNNNFKYSISSNSTKSDNKNLTEEDLLGSLNEASLAGHGVRIWYQLPDNYDPSKEYPLFLYCHGTGECFTEATDKDGNTLSNNGVHFNIGNVTGVWATTEDMGYEDVIVVAPQYYSGNQPREDGYERDDSIRATLCYALSEFSVDRDKVYVSGTSQGAGRTTALLRDCAEYLTAVIVQNGGYSSALAKEEDAVPVQEEIFQYATDNNVAVWFFQGVNDPISPRITAETMYQAVVNDYRAKGKSEEWIQDNARFTYLGDKIYLDMNESSFHSTMKPTYKWYAYYNSGLYQSTYSSAEDSLGEYFDTRYGANDPQGYTGLVDWALAKEKPILGGSGVTVQYNGKTILTDAYVDSQERSHAPVETAEVMGITVTQDGDSATFSRGGTTITITAGQQIGDTVAVKDYVPLRYLAETFGMRVEWKGANRIVILSDDAQDIDAITEAKIDYSQSAQIPLEGWYVKKLDGGRQVLLYFPTYAACRAYFTVVAVPDGAGDARSWAAQQGYTQLMDQRGEVLALLLPDGAWGGLDKELPYVTSAMSFINSGANANGITLFTNYSTFYLAGYGAGAAALEAWAADNPILVDSQVYIGGKSAGEAYLSQVGAKIYDGTNTGGYDPGISDLAQFQKVLADHGYDGKAITRSQVALPTWFAGYGDGDYSIGYWKSANDCVSSADADGVFWQSKDSDAFQTEYANSCTEADHGISQVKVTSSGEVTAEQVAGFLYGYSRYNVPFAYSNHLSERQDYTAVRVAAQKTAQSAPYLSDSQKVLYDAPVTSDEGVAYDSYYVLAREQGKAGQGTMESGIVAFSDDNGDGQLDAREYLLYIPDSAKGTKAPVVFQFPGMTQSVGVGFDSTQWWRVANDEGVIVVIVGEAYNNGVALSWKNSDMAYRAISDILKKQVDGKDAEIDWTRIYGSGHSLGSGQVQTFVRTHPEFFAAVGSTSFGSTEEGSGEPVPTMLVTGQSDLPFLMSDLWTSEQLQQWFQYLAQANGLTVTEATPDNASSKVEGSARTWMYTWNNKQDIPMVVWGQTYLREHNCYPAEVPAAWEFIRHYSRSADGVRSYSPSGFAKDDAVVIEK